MVREIRAVALVTLGVLTIHREAMGLPYHKQEVEEDKT